MLSRIAAALVPAFGRLTVTADAGVRTAPGAILVANHTSLADPAVVVAALRRYGIEPVILATSGLWRVPLLGPALRREGHIAVHRGTARAADSLDAAAVALASGRSVLLYGEGGLPVRRDAGETAPGPFRSGLARLAAATGAPVVPVGQAGARRLCSGSSAKQFAGVVTAPCAGPASTSTSARPCTCPTACRRRRTGPVRRSPPPGGPPRRPSGRWMRARPEAGPAADRTSGTCRRARHRPRHATVSA